MQASMAGYGICIGQLRKKTTQSKSHWHELLRLFKRSRPTLRKAAEITAVAPLMAMLTVLAPVLDTMPLSPKSRCKDQNRTLQVSQHEVLHFAKNPNRVLTFTLRVPCNDRNVRSRQAGGHRYLTAFSGILKDSNFHRAALSSSGPRARRWRRLTSTKYWNDHLEPKLGGASVHCRRKLANRNKLYRILPMGTMIGWQL